VLHDFSPIMPEFCLLLSYSYYLNHFAGEINGYICVCLCIHICECMLHDDFWEWYRGGGSVCVYLCVCLLYVCVCVCKCMNVSYSMNSKNTTLHSGVARKIFLLRQRLATCIGRKVFGRERVRGTLHFRGF